MGRRVCRGRGGVCVCGLGCGRVAQRGLSASDTALQRTRTRVRTPGLLHCTCTGKQVHLGSERTDLGGPFEDERPRFKTSAQLAGESKAMNERGERERAGGEERVVEGREGGRREGEKDEE